MLLSSSLQLHLTNPFLSPLYVALLLLLGLYSKNFYKDLRNSNLLCIYGALFVSLSLSRVCYD